MRRAVDSLRDEDISREERLRWLWLGCRSAVHLWDDEAWDVLSARFVQLARDAGALTVLPLALNTRSRVHVVSGEFAVASSLVDEAAAVNEATGTSIAPYGALTLAAFQGREAEASQLIEAATPSSRPMPSGGPARRDAERGAPGIPLAPIFKIR